MGLFKYGAQCCNNCRHWRCHSQRKIRGNPPAEIYTDSNCDKCSLTNRSTLSKDSCDGFSHLYGASVTFQLPKEKEVNTSEVFMQSILDFARETRAINAAGTLTRTVEREVDDDLDGAAEHEFARSMAEQGKANNRTHELIKEGMSVDCMFKDKAVEFMRLLDRAKGGDAKAQFALARAFWEGTHGCTKEDEESVYGHGWHWCNESADNDYAWAQLWKGVSWRNDAAKSGLREDHEKAVKWLEMALRHTEIREKDRKKGGMYTRALNSSRITLGVKCLIGKDIAPDYSAAIAYFEAVEKSGDSRGTEYKKKAESLRSELEDNLNNLRELVADDVGVALNEMGKIFAGYPRYRQYQLVVGKDLKKAVDCFAKAADELCPDAMDNLGDCYDGGIGVEKDILKAAGWYGKAAEYGSVSGQFHYARCLWKGNGIKENKKEALRWYMEAGANKHGRALNMLGWCAEGGRGMQKDPELAFEWYRRAAEAGDAESMYELGRFYKTGYGCTPDEAQGDEWQKKAKENGYSGGW